MGRTTGNIYVICTVAVIGGVLYGFDIASLSAILSTRQYNCYFDQSEDGSCSGPEPVVQGGITASMAGGSWIGSLFSGLLMDKVGRKWGITTGALLWVIGSAISAACQNIPMLIGGRIVNGVSVGILSAQVPVYISETSPPSKRGMLIAIQEWAITWGILVMFFISYGCSFLEGTKAFRIPWSVQAVPAIILMAGMVFLPESPRWYAQKDRWEECHDILAQLHGNGDRQHPTVQAELAEIRQSAEVDADGRQSTYFDLFKPKMLWRTHIGVFVQIWSQLTGMNVMMYYITYIFRMADLKGNTLLLSSSIQYVINVLMVIPAIFWADKWGRRNSMLAGSVILGTCLFANGALMGAYGTDPGPRGVDNTPAASTLVTGPPAKAIIALSYIVVGFFAATWGPISWTYPPELFPLRLRSKGMAFATSANWATNFALGYFVPPAFVNIRYRTFFIFGVFCVAMGLHAFFCFPETAGKSLEEVERMFTSEEIPYVGTPAWRTKKSDFSVIVAEQELAEKTAATDGPEPQHETVETRREFGEKDQETTAGRV